jgi:RNA polymerase sigma-54 factor
MQQSLHLLQATIMELQTLVSQEMEVNPTLEESPTEEEIEQKKDDDEDGFDKELEAIKKQDEEWREYFSQNEQTYRDPQAAQEKHQFVFDSQIQHESLSDHLMSQLIFATKNEEELRVGEEIIGNINEDGFFSIPLGDIINSARVSLDTAQRTLSLIQSFHPAGVAARDLREALLLQLERRGKKESLEYQIVQEFLDELGRKRYTEIAKKLNAKLDSIVEAANLVAKLNPRPAAEFAPDQPQNVVQVEAAFIFRDGEWQVQMNNDSLPRLRISNAYKDLLGEEKQGSEVKDYLKDKIRSAKFMIKCIHQRQETLFNILKQITIHQKDFLLKGVAGLKPLTMNDVAALVKVHETTVSRAVANKYVETPWGVYPIKFFFTSGFVTDEGQVLSNTTIKEQIEDLIGREDPLKPYSDSEIVTVLKEKGIDIARRTVAKYRLESGILPSNLRKKS